MDYDKTTVTLKMTRVQFETVHDLLSQFVHAVEAAPDEFDTEAHENVKNIKSLEYTFEEVA